MGDFFLFFLSFFLCFFVCFFLYFLIFLFPDLLKKRGGGERMERREEGRAGSGVGVREDLLSPGVLHVMSAAKEEIDAALAMASARLL